MGYWGCNIALSPFNEPYCVAWERDEEGLRQGKLPDFTRNVIVPLSLFI
jgi:hypothetical protein